MIYCQKYLMDQGLAVTWDNPDIHLERGGTPVPSWELHPNTEYDVIARIWNGSNEAPAVNMPVRYSYLDFGIGGVSVPIGQTTVDLPVNGAPGCPAFATMKWTTPKTPGHYCLQVELIWPDDANPQNNLGQENTDVIALNSPRGRIAIPVRNAGRRRQALRLEADTYALPRARPCDEPPAESSVMSDEEVARHKRDALATHDRAHFPVPQGWEVGIEPREVAPEPGEAAEVVVDVTAPDGFVGRQPLNVLAFDGPSLVGGVTLYVEGTG